jgi:hypothetical protein
VDRLFHVESSVAEIERTLRRLEQRIAAIEMTSDGTALILTPRLTRKPVVP